MGSCCPLLRSSGGREDPRILGSRAPEVSSPGERDNQGVTLGKEAWVTGEPWPQFTCCYTGLFSLPLT